MSILNNKTYWQLILCLGKIITKVLLGNQPCELIGWSYFLYFEGRTTKIDIGSRTTLQTLLNPCYH